MSCACLVPVRGLRPPPSIAVGSELAISGDCIGSPSAARARPDGPRGRCRDQLSRHRRDIGAAVAEESDLTIGPVQLAWVEVVRAQALQGIADVDLVEARALAVGAEPVRGAAPAELVRVDVVPSVPW